MEDKQEQKVKVTCISNGPFKVKGNITVELPDGELIEKGPVCSLCACGHSENKPFCDGSHKAYNS